MGPGVSGGPVCVSSRATALPSPGQQRLSSPLGGEGRKERGREGLGKDEIKNGMEGWLKGEGEEGGVWERFYFLGM